MEIPDVRATILTAPSRVDALAALLRRHLGAPEKANLRYHAMVGTGVCVGEDAGHWWRGGKACPTILAASRDVPEGDAPGHAWRTSAAARAEFWGVLDELLRRMTEDEAREAMLRAGA